MMSNKEPLVDLLKQCMVRVELTGSTGTGFFVAPHRILTCEHVIQPLQDGQIISVYWRNHEYRAHIVQHVAGPYPDLALLDVEGFDDSHPCVWLNVEAHIDDPLYGYGYPDGYPGGSPATFTYEGVAFEDIAGEERPFLTFKGGEVRPGFSGGPLLNLRTGGVCGLIRRTRGADTLMGGRAIPVSTIARHFPELLNENRLFHQRDQRWSQTRVEYLRQIKSAPQPSERIWNVPFLHNPFFTGRTEILETIHHGFTSPNKAPLEPQALCGMAGIGKTQIALEYAHHYRNEYDTILWVKADSLGVLKSDFVSLAYLLNLHEKDEQEERLAIQAVKLWFDTHSKWLLIFDGADDLQLVWKFLPTAGIGHILLTTQTQSARRLMRRIVIEQMKAEEGIRFLLRRANPLLPGNTLEHVAVEEAALAKEIVELMEGHPLALDQAGAYIEETNCSLSDYLHLYQAHQIELLKRRGDLTFEHPESVVTAISLSMDKVRLANFAALLVLNFLAFLHPDAIPEEIITEGSPYLGPLRSVASDPHKLNEAISQLLKFSLISRNPEKKTLRMHRLIQTLSKSRMKEETQRRWSERAVQAVNQVFASPGSQEQERYWLYMPHVYECETLIKQWEITSWEALELLVRAGSYLRKTAHYAEAEPLVREALDRLYQDTSQPNFFDVASSLENLAALYRKQRNYSLAEPLHLRALTIYEQMLGAEHLDTARSLNNLAELYHEQGKYTQAEPLYQRALAIKEQQLGPEHPNTAGSLNNLAALYREQGKYTLAEPLLLRALAIYEQMLGEEHPNTVMSLSNLAVIYHEQGKYTQAEPLLLRALAVSERMWGAEHLDTARSLSNLAALYYEQGKYTQAEPLLLRALAIEEQQLGPEHPNTAARLNNLAELYRKQGKYMQAEPLLLRVLAIGEQQLGPGHAWAARSLNNLAELYRKQGKYTQAEPLLLRALAVSERMWGAEHLDTVRSLNNLAELYHEQGKYTQAEPLYQRALAIEEQQLGPEHPNTQKTRANYTALLEAMKQDEGLSL